jgi:hypothetical protein
MAGFLKGVILFLLFMILILHLSLMNKCKVKEYHEYDLNKDGVVDLRDLIKLQKYLIENRE